MTTTTDSFRCSITDFGAVGDGTTLCTQAIQAAFDQIGAAGGGTVVVPPGTYRTGTVFLRSGTTLELHPAARLLGSPDLSDYIEAQWGQHIDRTPWHLLAAIEVENVVISGGGTIDGNGPAFWEDCVAPVGASPSTVPGAFQELDPITCVPARHDDPRKGPVAWIRANKERRPSPMIEISGCRNVVVSGVHITNSAGWLLHLHNTKEVRIQGVRLTSNLMGPNNDGFDITGCHDVLVSDCTLSCCDDAICLKTTPDSMTCERVTVTNCIIRTKCVALKFGCSETFHDFKQVTFSNCVVTESSRAVGIYTRRGGNIEDVTITNIVCDTRNPFMMNRPVDIQAHMPPDEVAPGRIRNVTISNLALRTDGRCLITAEQPGLINGLILRDWQISYPTIDDPQLAAAVVTCGQLPLKETDALAARAAVVCKNVHRLVIDNLLVDWPQTDADGRIDCPTDWCFELKACNGMFDAFFERPEFTDGTVPPFHAVWAKGIRGGSCRVPDASGAGAAAVELIDCDWTLRD